MELLHAWHGPACRRDADGRPEAERRSGPGGAVEWLPLGAGSQHDWENAIRNTLAIERRRYLCVFGWNIIKDLPDATRAITAVLAAGAGGNHAGG